MRKTLILLIILFASFVCSALTAAEPLPLQAIPHSRELKPYLDRILQIEEARQCFAKSQQEGLVSVLLSDHPLCRQFGALWDTEDRAILINLEKHQTYGSIIGSILFEMQNALAASKFARTEALAHRGELDKESFVEAMERIEYENSLNAAHLAKIGIEKGLFPKDARLHTYDSFEEYYYFQKVGHHRDVYERAFDDITAYNSSL